VTIGPFQILIIALVLLVLFGRGRISDMMGDIGKGVKTFRRNLEDEPAPLASLEGPGDAAEAAAEPLPARDQTYK
jgi:sec-independent protein translocase protein TatA